MYIIILLKSQMRETQAEIDKTFSDIWRESDRSMNAMIKKANERAKHQVIKMKKDEPYIKILDSLEGKISIDELFDLTDLLNEGKYDELDKELAKLNKSSTITLAKIPKVPKVPSKKISLPKSTLKSDKKINKKIDDIVNEVSKMKPISKTKPKATLKSNAKLIKEIDDLVREVEELERMAMPKKKITIKSGKKAIKDVDDAIKEISKMKRIAKPKKTEIETVTETKIARPEELKVVKKRGRPPKVKTETDVEAVVSKPKRGRPRKTPVEPEKPKQTKKDIKISEDLDAKTRAKRANAIDVLKTKFNHFRRSLRYLPNTKEEFKNESVEQRLDDRYYYDEAVKLLTEANAKYREYKSEGLITKEDLDKIMDLFEYEEYRKKYLLFKSIFE